VGDGNFHIIPLVDITDRVGVPFPYSQKVYDLVLDTIYNNDGLVRMYWSNVRGEHHALFKRQRKFLTGRIDNPGKIENTVCDGSSQRALVTMGINNHLFIAWYIPFARCSFSRLFLLGF
jgi:hypothetical protein